MDEPTLDEVDQFGLDDYISPPPSKVFSVRFRTDELETLHKVAESKGVAPSTLVRTWTVHRLATEYELLLGRCPRCGQITPAPS